jgi:NADH-quinone oxidoreductase subunit M
MRDFLTSIGYESWAIPALLTIPLLGALVVWAQGAMTRRAVAPIAGDPAVAEPDDWARGGFARGTALAFFLVEFIVSLGLWFAFDIGQGAAEYQFAADWPWIPEWGIRLAFGIDGMALMMVLLTTFLMPLAVLGSWTSVRRKSSAYYVLMMLLTVGMLGVFVVRDLFLFYVMFEIMLVPMYFIIGIWGGERRIYASIKFFIYTMLGSLLMLVAIIYLGINAGGGPGGTPDFSYEAALNAGGLSLTAAKLMFFAFSLAFAVKVPMFPFHTWLPDAHVEAPTAGSVILAGIMLKVGTYGFLRFSLPLFPDIAMTPWVRSLFVGLAVVGIIYGALVAMVQPDFKKLVAYSSVSHLGFVMLGIFALTVQSVQGALMVMISHGISTGALFLLIGMIYERRHTRMIADYGGIARAVPLFSALLTFVSLSSIGLPGTNGFIGEFLVLIGSFRTYPVVSIIATTGVIFAAAYLLWAIQRILFNALDKPVNAHVPDLNWREIGLLAPLIAAIIWLGVYPKPVLERMQASAERVVELVESRAGTTRTDERGPVRAAVTAEAR